MIHVSVILPTFNERGNIVRLVEKIKTELVKSYPFEVLIVDDNSTDGTAVACKTAFKNNQNIKIFERRNEKGLATAIYYGIQRAKGKFIVVMDTDFNHDPSIIPVMLKKIKKNTMVIGSRYISGGGMANRKRYWLSKFYNSYLHILLQIPLTDFVSGFFCIERDKLMELIKNNHREIFAGYGDYFMMLIMLFYKSGGLFLEIPVYYKDRDYGISKSNFIAMFLEYTQTSLKIFSKYRLK